MRVLDTGTEGVVIPSVDSADDTRAAVAACLYPPAGVRGMAHVLCRASDYGRKAETDAARLRGNLVIMCMIESPRAVENIPEIAAVDGVDVLLIELFDLSAAMGLAGQLDHPDLAAMLERSEAAIRGSGKAMGTIATRVHDPTALFERGNQVVVSRSDVLHLRDAACADVRAHGRSLK